MVARRPPQSPPTSTPATPSTPTPTPQVASGNGGNGGNGTGAPRGSTPLLPILALMNGSALLALTLLVVWPESFNLTQQVVALLGMWLLINLLAVVLVRLIDSGRSGAASVNLSKDQAALRVRVAPNPDRSASRLK